MVEHLLAKEKVARSNRVTRFLITIIKFFKNILFLAKIRFYKVKMNKPRGSAKSNKYLSEVFQFCRKSMSVLKTQTNKKFKRHF